MIEADRVTKSFGGLVAVDDVSITASPGEVVGLLGHNGAGKTTLMRLIAGLLRPTSGRIAVNGMDPVRDGESVRSLLGVLPNTPQVDTRLTAAENLKFVAGAFDLDAKYAQRRADSLLAQFGLASQRDDMVSEFSTGMRQRLALARVLLSEPLILLLDEPTSGMDPQSSRELMDLLKIQTQVEGRIVITATHALAEAAELCDEVIILFHGAVIRQGTPDELVRSLGATTTISVTDDSGCQQRALELVAGVDPSARIVEHGRIEVSQITDRVIAHVVRLLVEAGFDVCEVTPRPATLEDLYFAAHGSAETALASGVS